MNIKPEEVSAVIRQELQQYNTELRTRGVGQVLQVGDGIARVYGLSDAMAGELIEFPGGVMGMALNLEEDNVGCILLGSDAGIHEGDVVHTTGRIVQVPVGMPMVGRVVNALGQPIDGKGPITATEFRPTEAIAPD
jgi:F-type H+-transporting ATPase subunit alpha